MHCSQGQQSSVQEISSAESLVKFTFEECSFKPLQNTYA